MEFITIENWDQRLWQKARTIYFDSFGEKSAKPEKIIKNMFRKKLCFLHLMMDGDVAIAMALTGKAKNSSILIIDYLAVLKSLRGKGLGHKLVGYIKEWCRGNHFYSILIEIESEKSTENLDRKNFWLKCGFSLTDYIHTYIWVPEPYQAMYLKLSETFILPNSGEELFRYITDFHKKSFDLGCMK